MTRYRIFLLLLVLIVAIEGIAYAVQQKNATPSIVVPDSLLNHKFAPNATYVDTVRGEANHIFTNSQSWAEHYDVQKEKPMGIYRIFYVGDSTTHGVVDEKYRLPDIIERELGSRVEVINAGTTSYSTLLYYLLIKNEILQYSPDLVVINIDMTDVRDDGVYRELAELDELGLPIAVRPSDEKDQGKYILSPQGKIKIPLPQRINAFAAKHSFIVRSLYRLIKPSSLAVPPPGSWLQHTWDSATENDVAFSMGILSETIRLLQSQGIKVMITGVPHYPQYTGQWSARPHEVLAQTAQELGIPYLNSYEALKDKITDTSVEHYYWAVDPTHLNTAGNALWANVQLKFLLDPKNDLLPLKTEGK